MIIDHATGDDDNDDGESEIDDGDNHRVAVGSISNYEDGDDH